jgi:hypothetical protein
VTHEEFNDRDEQAVWQLLGRHRDIEPSAGFAGRTLRRLHESPGPARGWWLQPLLRWAVLGAAAVALAAAAGTWLLQHRQLRRVELYVRVHQADYLEDFDVIAALDQLNGGHNP